MKKVQQAVQKIFKNEFGTEYEILSVRKIKGGFLSDAYVVDAKNKSDAEKKFFLKTIKGDSFAFERNEDAISSYLASQKTAEIVGLNPKSLGCFIANEKSEISKMNPLSDGEKLFQLQEFRQGRGGLDFFLGKEPGYILTDSDKKIIEKIAELLFFVHKRKFSLSEKKKEMIYKRSLRDIIAHPELTLSVFENNLKKSKIFKGQFRYDYLAEMIKVSEFFGKYHKRISCVHGDFWLANILVDKNKEPFFIDYSRLCYGDPGMDVGYFYTAALWGAIYYKKSYLKDVAEHFLAHYLLISKDKDIMKTAVTQVGFIGAVCLVEDFYPNTTNADRKKFAEYIFSCLKNKKLIKNHGF